MKIKLIYVGNGESVHGVPARDLTEEEVSIHGQKRLIESGLYKLADAKKQKNVTDEKGD